MVSRQAIARALGDARAARRLDILRLVQQHGSISQAARAAGVSYKAAWQALHTLAELVGEPVLDTSVGGAGGGGARLLPAGVRLLHAARRLEGARDRALDGAPPPELRSSMRNALRCRVLALDTAADAPMVRVQLALEAGDGRLDSLITRGSASRLGLQAGTPLLALCKATAVQVGPADGALDTEAGLTGRLLRLTRGADSDEVEVELAGGQHLVGFSGPAGHLRKGMRVRASVDAQAVVLAPLG